MMTRIIFRELPAVSTVERQLALHARDRLFDDDVEALPHLIDDASIQLFGITQRDTFYWALPDPVAAQYGRAEWEAHFDVLSHYTRDPNALNVETVGSEYSVVLGQIKQAASMLDLGSAQEVAVQA